MKPANPAEFDRALSEFLAEHRISLEFVDTAKRFYTPLVDAVEARLKRGENGILVTINGAQGSGKSTLGDFLAVMLNKVYQRRALSLSIDDFYLTKAEREALGDIVHPLLRTRGVPGTHDTALLRDTLVNLCGGEGEIAVPRFEKAKDDRTDLVHWPRVGAPLDVVILEGWCVGVPPQTETQLAQPINTLELDADADGFWRRYVNLQLALRYQPIFQRADIKVMLKAPNFDVVYGWRLEQEQKLAEKTSGDGIMSPAAIKAFINYYQRLTEHALEVMPREVDWLFELNAKRKIVGCRAPVGGAG